MGRVELALRVGSNGFRRVVAVKRNRPDLSSAEYKQMFAREVELLSHVVHPNVVAALDVVDDGGDKLLVMEYVHGESLAEVLFTLFRCGSVVPVRIAAAIACDILRGLHATHEAESPSGEKLNLVHRDVAPDNVLIGAEGISRLLDFGIATSTSRPGITRVGYLKGKVAYLAPERLNDEPVDRRVDIYGTGVVLWEALTGRKLFEGPDATVMSQVLAGGVAAPGSLVPHIPPELDAIVLRAVASKPDDRFATALEMALALRPFCGDASEVADWMRIVAGESLERKANLARQLLVTSASEQTVVRRITPKQRSSPWGLAAVMSVFGVAGAITAWQLGGDPNEQSEVAAPRVETPVLVAAALAPVTPSPVFDAPRQEPKTEVTPPRPKPRPTRIKKSAPPRAASRGGIDDGF